MVEFGLGDVGVLREGHGVVDWLYLLVTFVSKQVQVRVWRKKKKDVSCVWRSGV